MVDGGLADLVVQPGVDRVVRLVDRERHRRGSGLLFMARGGACEDAVDELGLVETTVHAMGAEIILHAGEGFVPLLVGAGDWLECGYGHGVSKNIRNAILAGAFRRVKRRVGAEDSAVRV